MAWMESGEYDKSDRDFRRALEVEPQNKSVLTSVTRLKKLQALQDKKDKARFKNLFEKLREDEQQTVPPASS